MATGNTTLLGLALPVQGELDGTWGDVVNASITSLVDSAVAGTTTLSANADVTLTTTSLAANQARQAVLLWTASNGATTRNITAPAQSKPYIVINAGTGSVVLRGVGPTTGVTIIAGEKCLAAWNGSDFVKVASSVADGVTTFSGGTTGLTPSSATSGAVTLAGTLAAANGGTGQSSYAVGDLVYASTTTALSKLADVATGNALVSGGVGVAPSYGKIGLTTHVSGILPVANGGTGATSLAANNVLLGNGTSAVQVVAPGVSGNVLTSNGTTWVSAASSGSAVGTGGTTATGSVTLTAASPATLTVTPATPGLYVTLPAATTCTKADNLFSIYNAGDYDYGVKDGAGTQLGWVRARTGAMIGLSDNTTTAGIWACYGIEKTGVTALYTNPTIFTSSTSFKRVTLDATRTCFLFGSDLTAIVYDSSTASWGSATVVRAGIQANAYVGILSATNQVLVCSCTTTTAFEAVTLTISGTTITVNSGTKATATLAGNYSVFGRLIAVGSSFVVSYGRATTTSGIRAITVSGTTPTIGAESAVSTASATAANIYATGSVVRAVVATASVLTCAPYTVSTSTLTAGTAATATTTAAPFRSFVNGNGNIVCNYVNTSHFATIFKLTGTTEAASSASLGNAPSSIATLTDYINVTASKTAFVWYSTGAATGYSNILTDTAGTASAGTPLAINITGAISNLCATHVSGTDVRASVGTPSVLGQLTLDCSGTSPTLASAVYRASTSGITSYPNPTDLQGVRNYKVLIAGGSAVFTSDVGTVTFDLQALPNSVTRIGSIPCQVATTGGLSGAGTSESWFGSVVTSLTGFVINRIEAAA